jgi:hypothetical protein
MNPQLRNAGGACRVNNMLRRLSSAAIILALVLGATACTDPATGILPDSVAVRVANPVAWPGGDLVVVSRALASQPALPVVLLDTLHLTVTRRNDSTVAARLPDTSGVFALHVQLQGGQRVGSVRLVGFVGRTDAPPLTGWPLPSAPSSPVVVAAAESTLVQIDMRTGDTTGFGIHHNGACAVSPGPSYRPSTVVAQAFAGGCQRAFAWSLASPGAPVDSGPNTSVADRIWAELSAGMWLAAAHHGIRVYRPADSTLTEQIESGERVIFSPDRSLAVVLSTSAPNGLPVIASATGSVTYRVPLVKSEGIVFSPDGDTIFAAGRANVTPGEPERLLAVAAGSGQVEIDTPITSPELWDLALDPDGPWLYGVALTAGQGWQPIIHVFDRATLSQVASIRPPAAMTCRVIFCGQVGLAIAASTRRLYVLEIANWGMDFGPTPSGIYTFELVPATQTPLTLSP